MVLSIDLIILPVDDILEIQDPCVVVVLPGVDSLLDIPWMDVRERVLVCIPTAITQIDAPHKCSLSIDYAQLFVVCPVQNHTLMHAIYPFESITGKLGNTRRIQSQVL